MLIVGGNQSAGGYEVANSLRFDDGSSDYLTFTPASNGNRKIFTVSVWVKRANLGINSNIIGSSNVSFGSGFFIQFQSGDNLRVGFQDPNQFKATNRLFRDVSAWYHIVVAVDVTQASNDDKIKIYVNGVQETSFSTSDTITNADKNWNNTQAHSVGRSGAFDSQYFDGYLAEVVNIDGSQLDPTSFGEFDEDSGIWKPIDVSGLTFGTNGFYLDFEDSGSLGADVSGNGNNFTVNNLTSIDQTTDTPTNNYATMNPLFVYTTNPTYSNGNCTTSSPTTGGTRPISTIEVPKTGKWYCEIKVDSTTGTIGDNSRIGIYVPSNATYNARYLSNGNYNLDASASSYGATFGAGDIIGIAVDSDSNTIEFYKNGVSQGSLSYTMQSNETYFFTAFESSNTIGINYSYNFGNPPFSISSGNSDGNGYGNFEYSVPSGYYALNTKNLAEYG